MTMKLSHWIITGVALACCLVISLAVVGMPAGQKSPANVLSPGPGISTVQGQLDSLMLDAKMPDSPESVKVPLVTSVDIVQNGDDSTSMAATRSIPSPSDAPRLAEKALEPYGGIPEDAQLIDAVPRYQYKYNLTTNAIEEKYPWQTQVRYTQVFDGRSVKGTTINLGLRENGELGSLVKIWPSYGESRVVKIVPAQRAYEKFRAYETMEKIQGSIPDGSKISNITLGYQLCGSWNSESKDPYLKPVWIFSVVTPADPEPFPLMVDAAA
ncbi:MAG: hypothetical protein LUQ71_08700 [Methanoregula sp.]|nr:hypothetical protein [Methanoregula sp.]